MLQVVGIFLSGVELTIQALDSSNKRLQLYAAGTLANLAKYPRASSLVRRYGGLPKLVALLEINAGQYSSHEKGTLDEDDLPLDLQVWLKTRPLVKQKKVFVDEFLRH